MENRSAWILALFGLLAAGVAVGIWWLRPERMDGQALSRLDGAKGDPQANGPAGDLLAPGAAALETAAAEGVRSAPGDPTPAAAGMRSEVAASAPVAVSVRNSRGEPIEGALVSLTPMEAEAQGFFYGALASDKLWLWRERSDRIAARTSIERTDANGLASLPRTPATDGLPPSAWALWASHRNHLAQVVIRADPGAEGGHPPFDRTVEFVLDPGPAAAVRVLDPDGAPIAGARVEQWALLPLDLHPSETALEVRARRVLVRRGETDAAGVHALEAYGGRQMVHVDATIAGAAYRAVVPLEAPAGTFDVQLAPTFELVGRVRWDGPNGPGPYGLVTVESLPEVGPVAVQAVAHVAPDGSFGPVLVPMPSGIPEFRVRLEHAGLIPRISVIPRPAPSERVFVEFETQGGFELWVQAVDGNTEEPLPDTHIRMFWSEPEGRAEGWTSSIGWTYFEALPEGEILLFADKAGYARARIGPLLAARETWENRPLRIDLTPAGRLEGTVRRGAKPATEFLIVVDRLGSGDPAEEWRFSGRGDGSFGIEALAPGPYNVRAILPGARVTQPELVTIRLEETAVVELAEVGGAQVVGRVLSKTELLPLSGVEAQIILAQGGLKGLSTLGDAVTTASDGRFALPYAPTGQSFLTLKAPGGDLHSIVLPAESVEKIDVGEILLDRIPRVDVEIAGDPGRPMDKFHVSTYGAQEWTQVSPDGVASIAIPWFGARMALHHPDGLQDILSIAARPDPTQPVRFHVRPGQVRVRLQGGPSAVDAVTFVHHTHYVDPDGQAVFRSGRITGREWVMAGIPAARAQVLVHALEGDGSGIGTLVVDAFGSGEAVVDLGPEAWVRLVDGAGLPLRNALMELSVGVAEPGAFPPREATLVHTMSDGDGRIRAPKAPPGFGGVWLVGGVTDVGVPFGELDLPEVEAGAAAVDLTVPTDLRLSVRVREAGEAVRHASVRVLGPRTGSLHFSSATDSAGELSFGPMGITSAWIELSDPRYFALPKTALPSASGTSVEIEAYSRTDLLLRVLDPAGQPVPGARATLVHRELATDVSLWIQSGRVQGALSSGPTGELQLAGLPRGRYRITLHSPTGTLSGELDLQPATPNSLDLVVQ